VSLPIRPARLIGPLVTLLLLAGAFLYVRAGRSTVAPTGTGPVRGGQLVSSIRAEPRTFNRAVSQDQITDLLNTLTQGRLVRVNRASFELEPWLAERWESSPNGRQHTLHLRKGVTWSDGSPFTSADVLFSLRVAANPKFVLASSLTVGGEPMRGAAPDAETVVVTFAAPSGIGIRLLDQLPILPKHKLEAAFVAGTFESAWNTQVVPADVVGTGPFVLREYRPGERVVLDRNPRYWRKDAAGQPLPYLDRLVLDIVPDQNAELLRLQSGAVDLTQDALRPEDFVTVRRSEDQGALTRFELGVATDADAFWFCLKPEAKKQDRRFAFVRLPAFRQALSHAVDREAFAQNVFLGEAVPVWGPITPGNRQWFTPNLPRYPPDARRALELLKELGLEDRDGNGVVEAADGTEARFTVLVQRGIAASERGAAFLREAAATIGVALDIVPLESGVVIQRMLACDYDAVYMRVLTTSLDPAGNLDMWLSSGSAHFWNLSQRTPATEWEQRIDTLMLEQAATLDQARRRDLFNDVQRILAENLPVLYFAAPRMYAAHTPRVRGVVPSVLRPPILWNADSLSVAGGAGAAKP
jgi:peptide/nickel transport system substrate-binding protein